MDINRAFRLEYVQSKNSIWLLVAHRTYAWLTKQQEFEEIYTGLSNEEKRSHYCFFVPLDRALNELAAERAMKLMNLLANTPPEARESTPQLIELTFSVQNTCTSIKGKVNDVLLSWCLENLSRDSDLSEEFRFWSSQIWDELTAYSVPSSANNFNCHVLHRQVCLGYRGEHDDTCGATVVALSTDRASIIQHNPGSTKGVMVILAQLAMLEGAYRDAVN